MNLLVKEKYLTKTKMSELVGWSEANGRRWVKYFKEYIPTVKYNNKELYTSESLQIVKLLKNFSDEGFTMLEIMDILKREGIRKVKKNAIEIKSKYKKNESNKSYKENIADTIPSNRNLLIPFLQMIQDGNSYSAHEITEKLVHFLNLTEDQRLMRYENKSDSILLSRIRSVRYSLKKEGYVEEISKLTYKITSEGIGLLNDSQREIEDEINELEKVVDPLTVVKEKIEELKNELSDNLLKQLMNVHWKKFEDIVVDLLTAMGYGDGEVTQRSNDGGLDGIIKEDKLGLENIYVQAKKWASNKSVGREVVQSFSGALDAKGARKGVFITTSYFTEGAKNYAHRLESKKIILIDGKELSKLMIDYNVGVEINNTIVLKGIDFDYFKDE